MNYKLVKYGLFLGALLFIDPAAAQTEPKATDSVQQDAKKPAVGPEEILDAFVERLGGNMQIQSYDTARISMKSTVSNGSTYNWTVCHNDELISSNTNDRQYFRVFSDRHGWSNDSGKEGTLLESDLHEQGFLAFPHYLTVKRLADLAGEMELSGSVSFSNEVTNVDHDTHELKLDSNSGNVRYFYFDKKSGELVKYLFVKSDGTENEYYYEYRERDEIGGLLYLSREFIRYSTGVEWNIEVEKIEFDVEFEKTQFECPKAVLLQISD